MKRKIIVSAGSVSDKKIVENQQGDARKARLDAVLRDNLKKRKARQRALTKKTKQMSQDPTLPNQNE